jgi:hypothetical protein
MPVALSKRPVVVHPAINGARSASAQPASVRNTLVRIDTIAKPSHHHNETPARARRRSASELAHRDAEYQLI